MLPACSRRPLPALGMQPQALACASELTLRLIRLKPEAAIDAESKSEVRPMASIFPSSRAPRGGPMRRSPLLSLASPCSLSLRRFRSFGARAPGRRPQVGPAPPQEGEVGLLKLLGLAASPESIDYVQNKTQFQLHTLLTEQRHPKTWNLGERVRKDTAAGSADALRRGRGRGRAARRAGGRYGGPRSGRGRGRAGHALGEEGLCLRLRGHGPPGQADGKRVLAALLAEGQGRRQDSGRSSRRRSARTSRTASSAR